MLGCIHSQSFMALGTTRDRDATTMRGRGPAAMPLRRLIDICMMETEEKKGGKGSSSGEAGSERRGEAASSRPPPECEGLAGLLDLAA
jgi:hypothetical protein